MSELSSPPITLAVLAQWQTFGSLTGGFLHVDEFLFTISETSARI
jgi:hypothetical protein